MQSVEVPDGIQVEIKGNAVVTKGSLGSNSRRFNDALLSVSREGNKITVKGVEYKMLAKKGSMAERSFAKQLMNDIKGVAKHYEYNMQVVFAHFPITVEIKDETVYIRNLIGERAPRTARIAGSTKVEAKGQNIRVYGTSLDDVRQTCANLRKACRIRRKDSRVFQDGIYFALE